MATVFMKWLETRPQDYDRGIRLLTLGKLVVLHNQIVHTLVQQGSRVLEIGCGTGALTGAMASHGAQVTAIDIAPAMLEEARRRVTEIGLQNDVDLQLMDASLIGDRFEADSFDLVVSSLAFSEMTPQTRAYVLKACGRILAPGGKLAILDEVQPDNVLSRLIYFTVRIPLRVATWLLTRTTTHTLQSFEETLSNAGFKSEVSASYLSGSLKLFICSMTEDPSTAPLPSTALGRLKHQWTPRTFLVNLWGVFFRIIPPYPKVTPGLYTIGNPDPDSPVLVTGNFELTIQRLVGVLDGRVDAWLLASDSGGINVWCAAGGGFLTADKILSVLQVSGLDEIVHHRALILPQLCANGVDGWRLREESGWGVHWGPACAKDIPEYLAAGRKKTDAMRHVDFPLRERLEMMAVTLGFYGLIILVPIAIFHRAMFWSALFSLVGLSVFYTITLPWLPGRDGLAKSLPLALIGLAGLVLYSTVLDPVGIPELFNRGVGIAALSVFTAAELQGMSPLMRGEQGNWIWEAVIGVCLGLIYWLVPLVLGWR
jgi:ubiquinone/menaquinone biosynthesis C-methylase UbiE